MRDAGILSIKRALPRMVCLFRVGYLQWCVVLNCHVRAGAPKTYSIFMLVPWGPSNEKLLSKVPYRLCSNSGGSPRLLFALTTVTISTKRYSSVGTYPKRSLMFDHGEKCLETTRLRWKSSPSERKRNKTSRQRKKRREWRLLVV